MLQEMRAKRALTTHFATFLVADEAQDAPLPALASAVAAAGLFANEFVALRHGAMLRTARGQDFNSPPLLPVAAPVHDFDNGQEGGSLG